MFDPITAAVIGSAAIGAGSSILGSKAQSKAAGKAADAQTAAADRAAQVQWDMYEQTREDMTPWRETGEEALYKLSDVMGIGTKDRDKTEDFGALTKPFEYQGYEDPGYQFRFGEGQKALERSASAKGMTFSGRTGRELTRYGQEMGSQEYGNAFGRHLQEQDRLYNRYAGISGTGQSTAVQQGQYGMQTAGNVGNTMMTAGRAQAQGYTGSAQARASGYAGAGTAANQGMQNMLMAKYLDI